MKKRDDLSLRGWTLVVISLLIVSTLAGMRSSFSVFFKSLSAEFMLNRTETSSIFSVYLLFTAVFSLVKGWAIDRYEPKLIIGSMGFFTGLGLLITSQTSSLWQLYLGYSLLLSFGAVGIIQVLTPVISNWFDKNLGLALGIVSSGMGSGTIIIAPLAGYLISNFGWRLSYIVMGLLTLIIVIPLAMLLKKAPEQSETISGEAKLSTHNKLETTSVDKRSPEVTGLSLTEALKTRSYWLIASFWLLFAIAWGIVMTHIVPYAIDRGISTIEASTILSIMSGFHIVSGIVSGRTSDLVGEKIPCTICSIFGATALLLLIWSQKLWMFYVAAAFFGISYGGIAVIILTILRHVFGKRKLGTITGAIFFSFSIGAAIGSSLSGYIFDSTESYAGAFIIGALVIFLVIPLIIPIRHEIKTNLN